MGSGSPSQTTSTVTQTNLPEYAQPFFTNILERAQGASYQQYQPYQAQRTAGFTPAQEQIQQNTLGMEAPNQIAVGSALATQAGLGALQNQYAPGQFNAQQVNAPELMQYQMGPAMGVGTQDVASSDVQAAQTGYQPNLQAFQMGPVQQISAQNVTAPTMQGAQSSYGQQPLEQIRMQAPEQFGQAQVDKYMSPYVQNVLAAQEREAIRGARQGQIAQDLGAARQGTYGGSRQLLASMERERNLGQQLSDIQAKGLQSAYENAQQQFERDRAAGMTAGQANLQAGLNQQQLQTQTGMQMALANLSNEQQAAVNNQATQFQAQGMNADQAMRAALANQQAGMQVGQQNLQSQMQTQELGAQQGLQASLANLSNEQQARLANQAQQFQAQGMNADQAMRAALANQQAGMQVGQQNLQAALQTQGLGAQTYMQGQLANQQQNLEAQRLAEQSRQFGSQQGLAGQQLAGQMGQTLGNLGQYQQQTDLQRLQAQGATAAEQRQYQQQLLDQAYADFLRQRDFPAEVLGQYSNLLRGLPVGLSSTQTTYAPPPSATSQILGTGLGALGMYKTLAG